MQGEGDAQEAMVHFRLREFQRAHWCHLLFRQYDWLNWIPSALTDEIELTCILKDNQNLFKKNGPDCGRKQLHQSERMSYGCITLPVHSISAKCQQVFWVFFATCLFVFLGLLISIGLKFLLLSSAVQPCVKFVEFVKILRMMGFG